jgi:hypothetical protein
MRPARSCRHAREPGTSDDAAAPGQPGDMHGRQLVTRLGMAASPGSRGPLPPLALGPVPDRPAARRRRAVYGQVAGAQDPRAGLEAPWARSYRG